ncbi:hypothetical protein N7474_002480 [Penicillium riverlandense]|uniref:uncharacterized protein n=1 Tax=Penicillium riverlandense TaxID=1903569 RepID=UPI002549BA99|nr:uncharacterized protein N7474_002480 [Penicillium riverlandense]KAJ5825342.1 hypothetical protein N7474_002480 [Penicillium riverlandense]
MLYHGLDDDLLPSADEDITSTSQMEETAATGKMLSSYSIKDGHGIYSGFVTGKSTEAAIFPMAIHVNQTLDRIPADVVLEEHDAAREKIEDA